MLLRLRRISKRLLEDFKVLRESCGGGAFGEEATVGLLMEYSKNHSWKTRSLQLGATLSQFWATLLYGRMPSFQGALCVSASWNL